MCPIFEKVKAKPLIKLFYLINIASAIIAINSLFVGLASTFNSFYGIITLKKGESFKCAGT